MFTTLIVQPIFNLLVLIYNLIPGHNFGLAIILFTILIRFLLWPLVKRQLHQTKLMRKLQPDIKRVKKAAKGDKAKEATMMMELYKEKGVSLFASFRIILLQLPILFGLYLGLSKVVKDSKQLVEFSYPWIQHFGWMQELAKDFSKFDDTLFGLVDLTRPALGPHGLYIPALILVIGSAAVQYFQSVQLMPQDKDSRSLRSILKDAGSGKQADQSEVNSAVGRSTRFLLPAMIFFFTVNLASALSLYWLTSGIVALIQQHIALRDDVDEMEGIANETSKKGKVTISSESIRDKLDDKMAIEGEIVESSVADTRKPATQNPKNKKASRSSKAKKRRK